MEITYTITLEDLMRYGEYLYRTSERAKRTKRAWCLFTPLLCAGWAAYYYWEVREFDGVFILIAGQALTSALFLPRVIDRWSLKATYRQFIVRPEKSDTGPLRLIVESDAVTEIAPHRETRRRWTELYKVEETDGYLYLFVTPKSAIIIPRHSFSDGRGYDDVRREIFAHAQARKT
jgi:YcxB-like protein